MTFDPRPHLMRLDKGDYLEVKWRLVWLHDEHVEGVEIATELVSSAPVAKTRYTKGGSSEVAGERFIFRARVTTPTGSATGWGSEDTVDFKDALEKAETKALGRALAALGYGAQFAADFADGPEPAADAPIPEQAAPTAPAKPRAKKPEPSADQISPDALEKLTQHARERGVAWERVLSKAEEQFDKVNEATWTADQGRWLYKWLGRATSDADMAEMEAGFNDDRQAAS